METLEPRIYNLVIHFDSKEQKNILRLCKDLRIVAEQQEPIKEDEWGLRGILEFWFLKIENSKLTLHIQKKHSTRKKAYLKELEEFFQELDNLDYVKGYEEV
jgi:hypothetical protein